MNRMGEDESAVDLDLLFKPRTLAVVGISKDLGRGGGFIWWKIRSQGFPGRMFPVSRSCRELDGIPCYQTLSEVPDSVDLVIAAVPAAAVEGVLEECAPKGVKFVVVHAAGFAELGEAGKALQEKIVTLARRWGIRLVGPNCMGIFCPQARLNTIVEVDPAEAEPGGGGLFRSKRLGYGAFRHRRNSQGPALQQGHQQRESG